MEMMWGMWGWSGMFFMFFGWLLVILAIGAGVWWLVREWRPLRRDSALELLRERYARGEISREEFESRRRDLAA